MCIGVSSARRSLLIQKATDHLAVQHIGFRERPIGKCYLCSQQYQTVWPDRIQARLQSDPAASPPPPPPPPALAAINSPVTALRSVVALSISVCVIVGSAAVTSSRKRVTVHVNRAVPVAAMAWAAVAGGSAAAINWRRRLFVQPRIVVPLVAIACNAACAPYPAECGFCGLR